MKKVIAILLSVALLVCVIPISAMTVSAATFEDINQSDVFVKQQTNYTCTLAAAVMLVRRAAMMSGNSNWRAITESSMRPTAWNEGSGLWYNFTYAGITISHATISVNRDTLISLLSSHPEGIEIYNRNQPHAVLLTDYTNGTFYCADSATGDGRKPLASCTLNGSGENGKISGITDYWYVSSPAVAFSSLVPKSTISVLPGTSTSNTIISIVSPLEDDRVDYYECHIFNTDLSETVTVNWGFYGYTCAFMLPEGSYAATVAAINRSLLESGSSDYYSRSDLVFFEVTKGSDAPSKTTTFDGHTYELYNNRLTWDEAKAFCEEKGGHLVTISSQEEEDVLYSMLDFDTRAWIGYTDEEKTGDWKWVTGEATTYTNWHSTQPDNYLSDKFGNTEHYAEIRKDVDTLGATSMWNDLLLVNSYITGFICEYDGVNTTPEEPSEEPVVTPSADFEYQFINDGRTVQITGYTGSGGDVVIPAMIEGKPVSEIADYAFYGCDSITSITIPAGVSHIGAFAFGYCNQLETVYYEGTEADREAMTIENGNDALVDATWTNPPSEEPSEPSADVVAGDADGDGETTMKDVLTIRKYIAQLPGATADLVAGDVDGDGELTMKDALMIRKFIAGLIKELGKPT